MCCQQRKPCHGRAGDDCASSVHVGDGLADMGMGCDHSVSWISWRTVQVSLALLDPALLDGEAEGDPDRSKRHMWELVRFALVWFGLMLLCGLPCSVWGVNAAREGGRMNR